MQIIVVLIAVSISLALFFLVSFLWASKSGQFEDTYGPAYRVLFDDEDETKPNTNQKQVECK